MKWPDAPRAERYHVWAMIEGVDEEMKLAGSPTDPDFTMEAVPADATVAIAISAINNGGESLRSAIVRVVLPRSIGDAEKLL